MKEKNFKWMVYTLLFLILYYVSKENVYIWFSGINAFMYSVGLSAAIIEVISKYIKKRK
jgi:hypothetical protein